MTTSLNWAQFAKAEPDLARKLESRVQTYDRCYSIFWRDDPARRLCARVDTGEMSLPYATSEVRYLLNHKGSMNSGLHSDKHEIGLIGLKHDWRIARIERDERGAIISHTIATSDDLYSATVCFGPVDQLKSARWEREDGPFRGQYRVVYGRASRAALIDHLLTGRN